MPGTNLVTLSYSDMCMFGIVWLGLLRVFIHCKARWLYRGLPTDEAWSRICEAYIALRYNGPGWFGKANIAGLVWILIWAVSGAVVWLRT